MKKWNYSERGLRFWILSKISEVEEERAEGLLAKGIEKVNSILRKDFLTIWDKDLSKNKDGDIFFKKGDKFMYLLLYDYDEKSLEKIKKDIEQLIKKKYKLK